MERWSDALDEISGAWHRMSYEKEAELWAPRKDHQMDLEPKLALRLQVVVVVAHEWFRYLTAASPIQPIVVRENTKDPDIEEKNPALLSANPCRTKDTRANSHTRGEMRRMSGHGSDDELELAPGVVSKNLDHPSAISP